MQVHKTCVFPSFPFIVLIVHFTMSTKGAARPLLHSRIEQLPKAFFCRPRGGQSWQMQHPRPLSWFRTMLLHRLGFKKWVSPPRQILELSFLSLILECARIDGAHIL